MIEAIKWHTTTYEGTDEEVKLYFEIIKNADTYANVITTANGAQQMTVDGNGVTDEILNSFLDLRPLWSYSPKTKLDRALMLTACVYYVKFDYLRKEIVEKNYIDIIYNTFSSYLNPSDKQTYKQAIETLKQKYLTSK